jgi:ubiquinone/menaquinone biosynthesis C-methylase UbiE
MEREIQQQFGAVAENYVTSGVHARGEDLPVLLDAAVASGTERALDLGTAVGHTALALAPRVGHVIGVDLTAEMLERATRLARERRIENTLFVRADVSRLPFSSASIDLVTSRYSAHHYADPAAVASEVARVLKPGGRLVLGDTVSPSDPSLDTFINAVELLRDRSHVRDYTVDQWLGFVERAGLRGEVVHGWDLRLDFAEWVERMRTPPQAVAMLRTLLLEAPPEAKETYRIDDSGSLSFCLKGAIIRAWKRRASE